jgi:hypothetical protein
VAHSWNPSNTRWRSGGSLFKASLGQIVRKTRSPNKPITKTGLVEWLKVKVLSSNPSKAKIKKKKKETKVNKQWVRGLR